MWHSTGDGTVFLYLKKNAPACEQAGAKHTRGPTQSRKMMADATDNCFGGNKATRGCPRSRLPVSAENVAKKALTEGEGGSPLWPRPCGGVSGVCWGGESRYKNKYSIVSKYVKLLKNEV